MSIRETVFVAVDFFIFLGFPNHQPQLSSAFVKHLMRHRVVFSSNWPSPVQKLKFNMWQ